jgi:hypothetical protein
MEKEKFREAMYLIGLANHDVGSLSIALTQAMLAYVS